MTKRMELSPGRADERKSRGHQREASKGEIPLVMRICEDYRPVT